MAALLKQFLRDLPVPLLTDEYIEAFAQVESKFVNPYPAGTKSDLSLSPV